MSNILKEIMPNIFDHEGIWEGTYRHLDINGETIDFHQSRVECIFPQSGSEVYIQRNTFIWPNGQKHEAEFSGVMIGQKIYWDTDTFSGYGWMAGNDIFLLELDRKDQIGARFTEIIVMGKHKDKRARTWHWFKDGACFKRTLCDEIKIG